MARQVMLAVLGVVLAGCAGGPARPYGFPTAAGEPRPWPDGGRTALLTRFDQAATQPAGNRADEAAVVTLALRDLAHPRGQVEEVRWLGPDVALARAGWQSGTPLGGQQFLYVLQKQHGQWQVFQRYLVAWRPAPTAQKS